jgi:hypothetical protein
MLKKNNEIVIYQTKNGQVEVNLKENTVWLSLNQIGLLFGRDKSVISRHIKNIFKTNELSNKQINLCNQE